MPPFAWMLTDAEVADVLTDVRNEWDNSASAVAPAAVQAARMRSER